MPPTAIPLNVGPMAIYLDGDLMPPTKGGTKLKFSFETLDSVADVTGSFPRAQYYVGGSAVISSVFTEMTLAEVLELFPSTDPVTKMVTIPIGYNAANDTKSLLLRPIIEGEVSMDDDLAIFAPRVMPRPNFDVEFSLSSQRVWAVDFVVAPYDPVLLDFSMIGFGVSSYTPGS